MNENIKIEITRMQETIIRIITEYGLDITSLGYYITEAIEKTGYSHTFKLITMEEAKKWKEEYQKNIT